MATPLKERLVKSRVRLLKKSPFFGTLLLNAPWREDDSIPTACTDGRGIMFNPDFAASLTDEQLNGILLHELLHCALLHVPRMKDYFLADPQTANISCDIVVNGIIDDNGLELPEGAIRDNKLKHLSVREIYSILKQKQASNPNHLKDKYGVSNECLQMPGGEGNSQGQQENKGGYFVDHEGNVIESPDWKDAMNKAATIARMKKAGPVGAAMERIFSELLAPTIDWRTILYRYITESRNDFEGYDRRFVYNNLYVDDFSGMKAHVLIYIDVSGSIDEGILTEFMSEIHGAINAVSEVTGEVHCFDTRLHYVCDIADIATDFKLIGGGGTCFECIFKHIEKYKEENLTADPSRTLPIILTDGYAYYENLPRTEPTLWAISPGGVESNYIPFGDVVRIESV